MPEESKIINFSIYILLIAVIFAIGYFFIRPQINQIKILRADSLAWKNLLNQKQQTLTKFNKIAVTYKEKQLLVNKIQEMISPSADILLSLVQFENLASQSGMVIKNISFGALAVSGDKTVGIFPIDITLDGGYDAFKNYLQTVSTTIPLTEVESFTIGVPSSPGIFPFTVKLNTYTNQSLTDVSQSANGSTGNSATTPTPSASPTTTK